MKVKIMKNLAYVVIFLIIILVVGYGYIKLFKVGLQQIKSSLKKLRQKAYETLISYRSDNPNRKHRIRRSGGDLYDPDDDIEQIELDEKFYRDVVDEYDPHRYDDFGDYDDYD